MGKDKALLPFGEYRSLAQFQYERFQSYFKEIYLSAKTDKFDFDCKVIKDTQEAYSPLIAILSIFEKLDVNKIFILSVDAPFISTEIIEKILNTKDKTVDVAVANSPSGVQPLCGYYKKSMLPIAYAQLAKRNHKLLDLLALSNTQLVTFTDDMPFSNLNHPSQYEEALKRS